MFIYNSKKPVCKTKKDLLWATFTITVLFLISRCVIHWVGVRFFCENLSFYYQFLDVDLLMHDLLRSIFYLHSQPPLFNLFLGTILKISSSQFPLVFHLVYLVSGLTLALSLFWLMIFLKASIRVSFVIVCIFMLSPSCVLYENYLYNTYLVAALLCMVGVFLHMAMLTSKKTNFFIFFMVLALIIFICAIFQVYWFLLIALGLCYFDPKNARRILLAGVLPLCLIGSLYCKNLIVFKFWGTSSWLGMNFNNKHGQLKQQFSSKELSEMIKRGKIDAVVLFDPFSPVDRYQDLVALQGPKDIPALSRKVKTGTPFVNFNHYVYVEVSKKYFRGTLDLIKFSSPYSLGELQLRSVVNFFYPAEDNGLLDRYARYRLNPLIKVYSVMQGQVFHVWPEFFSIKTLSHIGFFIPFAWGIAVMYAFFLIWKHRGESLSQMYLVFLLLSTILYVSFVSVAFEQGECNRMRFMIDPYILALVGMFLSDLQKHGLKGLLGGKGG